MRAYIHTQVSIYCKGKLIVRRGHGVGQGKGMRKGMGMSVSKGMGTGTSMGVGVGMGIGGVGVGMGISKICVLNLAPWDQCILGFLGLEVEQILKQHMVVGKLLGDRREVWRKLKDNHVTKPS